MTIHVLLVDDQALFREGLETLLSVHKDIQVVGNASNGQEAVEVAAQVRPDVVLMDVRMPVLDGVRATSLLKDALPQCRVIVLTTFDDDEYIFDALRSGAVGYLLKDVDSTQLVEAIRAAARGESILEPSVAAKVIAEFSRVSSMVPSMQMEQLVEPLMVMRWIWFQAWICARADDPRFAAMVATNAGRPLKAFSIRKSAKDHGMGGRLVGPVSAGDKVAILEDTTTTGSAAVEAASYALSVGLEILQAIALVDRSSGVAAQRFAELDIPHLSLVSPTDLGVSE